MAAVDDGTMLVEFDVEEFVHVAEAKTEIPVVGPETSVV